jgi:hypothetical protein
MEMHALARSLGDARADATVRGLVGLFELVFPGRVRGYCLLGSYTNATPVAISDIDLAIVFKDDYRDEQEEEAAQRMIAVCQLISPIRLDVTPYSETSLRPEDVRLKLGSALVYGEDIRERLPLPEPAAHTRYITGWANAFVKRLHDAERLPFPLRYPDPDCEFYGYDRKRVDAWYPPEVTQGTKELVATVCWTATALLSLQAGRFAGTKADAIRLYAEAVGGEWAPFVQDLYRLCKGQWQYAVPRAEAERRQLRALCARTLPYLNHYLAVYHAYLLRLQAQGTEDDQRFAHERLAELG